MVKKIVQRDDPVLRKTAEAVREADITSPRIKKIIEEMKKALASQDDGVAIAAPQIGYSLRIFVVSHKVKDIIKEFKGEKIEEGKENKKDEIYINPVIKKVSKEKMKVDEGCLSVRYLYGEVERAKKVSLEAFDEKGVKRVFGAVGLMSQIFQHEVEHLDGILFTDKAENLEEIPPEKMKANTKK